MKGPPVGRLFGAAAVGFLFSATPLWARPEFSYYARDRNVSVADRPHPELDPLGVRLGGLLVYPTVRGGISYDDNIYALRADRVSDEFATLEAAVDVVSRWSSNGIGLHGDILRRQYVTAKSENATEYRLSADGSLDLPGGSLTGRIGTWRRVQPRTDVDAPNAARSPIRYRQTFANVQGQEALGRLRILGSIDWGRFRFRNAETSAGLVLDQHYRDRDVVTGDARLDYALDPRISIYVDTQLNSRSYRTRLIGPGLERDSRGYVIEAGSDFDITRLVRGHVQFGYLSQTGRHDQWRVRGLSGRGIVQWFTTPVLTLTLEGGRSIEDAADTDTPAYASTSLQMHADYELLRSLVITALAGRTWDRFENVDLRARRLELSLGARYRMRRSLVFELTARHLAQHHSGTFDGRSFRDNRIDFTIQLQR